MRARRSKTLTWAGALVMLAVSSVAVAAAPSAGSALAELRVEVANLSRRLEEVRDAQRDRLATLRAQRAELERQVRQAKIRKQAMARVSNARADELEALDERSQAWRQAVSESIEVVRSSVKASLPFARQKRLAALDSMQADLDSGGDPGRTLERLWRFVEDEAQMAQEVSLGRQAVEFERGEPQLMQTLRLGMALLYVRASDETVGWARRGPDGTWIFEAIDDPEGQRIVKALFAAHEANEGFGPATLWLPNPLALEAGADPAKERER